MNFISKYKEKVEDISKKKYGFFYKIVLYLNYPAHSPNLERLITNYQLKMEGGIT